MTMRIICVVNRQGGSQ